MNVSNLKEILFNIMESSFSEKDIQATQQMGVNLSNSIKKDGVTIIQNQNIEVYARIIPQLVQALRICDQLQLVSDVIEASRIDPPLPKLIEAPPVDPVPPTDPADRFCEDLFKNNYSWEEMQDFIRRKYIEFVCSKFNTVSEAAVFLKIQPSYLSKLRQKDSS